jgi:hypothetical protein
VSGLKKFAGELREAEGRGDVIRRIAAIVAIVSQMRATDLATASPVGV